MAPPTGNVLQMYYGQLEKSANISPLELTTLYDTEILKFSMLLPICKAFFNGIFGPFFFFPILFKTYIPTYIEYACFHVCCFILPFVDGYKVIKSWHTIIIPRPKLPVWGPKFKSEQHSNTPCLFKPFIDEYKVIKSRLTIMIPRPKLLDWCLVPSSIQTYHDDTKAKVAGLVFGAQLYPVKQGINPRLIKPLTAEDTKLGWFMFKWLEVIQLQFYH